MEQSPSLLIKQKFTEKDLLYYHSALQVAEFILSLGKPLSETSIHRIVTFDGDSFEKPLMQDLKICDRIVLVPGDRLRPEDSQKMAFS